MYAFSPTGLPIIGLAQTVPATAETEPGTFVRRSDGTLFCDWTGEMDLHWNNALADADDEGQALFVDADGALWPESAVVLRDIDASFTA